MSKRFIKPIITCASVIGGTSFVCRRNFQPAICEPYQDYRKVYRFHESDDELKSRTRDYHDWKILFKDADAVKEKLKKMRDDGPSHLMIISDFDATITSFYIPELLARERELSI